MPQCKRSGTWVCCKKALARWHCGAAAPCPAARGRPAGFAEKSSASVLPYLEGEEAAAEYERKRAETNAKSAASRAETKAETKALTAALGPRVAELLALEVPVPREWMTGGLVGETVKLRKLIAKGEVDRNAGRGDTRDRAGG